MSRIARRAAPVGQGERDMPVEAPGPQEGGVQHVGAVRGRQNDDGLLLVEPVHLGEDLVQRLLPLVISAAKPGAATPADGIEFVDEDHGRRRGAGGLEHLCARAPRPRPRTPRRIPTRRSRRRARPPRPPAPWPEASCPCPAGPSAEPRAGPRRRPSGSVRARAGNPPVPSPPAWPRPGPRHGGM